MISQNEKCCIDSDVESYARLLDVNRLSLSRLELLQTKLKAENAPPCRDGNHGVKQLAKGLIEPQSTSGSQFLANRLYRTSSKIYRIEEKVPLQGIKQLFGIVAYYATATQLTCSAKNKLLPYSLVQNFLAILMIVPCRYTPESPAAFQGKKQEDILWVICGKMKIQVI